MIVTPDKDCFFFVGGGGGRVFLKHLVEALAALEALEALFQEEAEWRELGGLRGF